MATDNEILLTIRAETDKATAEIKSLKLQLDRLSKSTKKSNGSFKGQEKAIESVKGTIDGLTKKLAGLATAYLGIAGGNAFISSMAEIEEGFVGIAKTTGASEEEMSKFKDSLYDLTETLHGISLTELQSIAEGAGQLGVAKEDIVKFTESIAKISVATNLSAEDASRDFAVIANVFGEPVENIEKLGSAVNELSATTAGTVGQIVDSTKRLAGVGKAFGLSASEVMAFSATLADAGVRTEIGASGLSRLFQKMQTDTEAFANASGVSIDKFANIMQNDPVEAVKLFASKLDEMEKAGVSSAQMLKDLGLDGSGTSQVVLALGLNMNKLTKNLNTANTAFEDGTSVQDEYAKASETINAKMADVQNAFVRMGRELMVTLEPALKDVLDAMVEFIDSIDSEALGEFASDIVDAGKAMSEFVTENKQLIKTILELGVAFIALNKAKSVLFNILGVGGLKVIASANTSSAKLATTLGILTKRVGQFGSALLLLARTNPVIAGISAVLGVALYAYNKYNESVEKAEDIQKSYQEALDISATAFTTYGEALGANNELMYESTEAQNEHLYAINDAIEANDKLLKTLKDDGFEDHKDEIMSLSLTNQTLRDTAIEVAEVTKKEIEAHNAVTEAVKKEREGKVLLNDAEKAFVSKSRDKAKQRVSTEQNVLQTLFIKNKRHYVELARLEDEISKIREDFNSKRGNLLDEYVNRVNDASRKIMTEKQKVADTERRLDESLAKARYAYSSGDLETAQKYYDEYADLSSQVLDNELEKHKDNYILKKRDVEAFAIREKELFGEKNALIDATEAKEIAIHNGKIDMKLIEMASLKTEIKLQMESVKAMEALAEASGKVTVKADLEPFKKLIEDTDAQMQVLSNKKRDVKLKLSADTVDADRATDESRRKAGSPLTLKLYGDNQEAIKSVDEVKEKASAEKAIIYTYADTTESDGKIKRVVTDIEGREYVLTVEANSENATAELDDLMRDINTQSGYITIDSNVDPAMQDLESLKTSIGSSTGTMTVYADASPANTAIQEAKTEADNTEAEIQVGANISRYDDKIRPVIKDETKHINIRKGTSQEVDSYVREVKKPITSRFSVKISQGSISNVRTVSNELGKDIISRFGIRLDENSVNNAFNIRNLLSQDIYITQYIRTEHIGANKNGGAIGGIEYFNSGGWAKRSGALGGYGGGDQIKSMLEAGEFIQRKEAVKKYGVNFMYALNNMKIPVSAIQGMIGEQPRKFQIGGEVRRYKIGGSVEMGKPIAEPQSRDLNPINLNFGNQEFQVLAESDIAEQLVVYMRNYGGR